MENTIYKDELTKSMNYLASKNNTIFVGQQIVYRGNPMSTTIEEVPKDVCGKFLSKMGFFSMCYKSISYSFG